MRPPEFWRHDGALATMLEPAAMIYDALGQWRAARRAPFRAPAPVLCVGNITVGGAGKTPTTIALARILASRGRAPAVLSRGHGGRLTGPIRVDASMHGAEDVGDEPLLIAREAPTWIARDRAFAARAACAAGADILVMDDGFQNTSLIKDLSLVVVDGDYGMGNGRVMPAGPLRENLARAMVRANAFVMIGEDRHGLAQELGARAPVLAARMVARQAAAWRDRRVIAFAGIFRPEKFWRTLEEVGAQVIARHAFADHHRFGEEEIARLIDAAVADEATLITTEKDLVRVPAAHRARIATLAVDLRFADEAAVDRLLAPLVKHG